MFYCESAGEETAAAAAAAAAEEESSSVWAWSTFRGPTRIFTVGIQGGNEREPLWMCN